ncbi:Inner membrane protein YbhQ [Salmonella enterica subsp. enterica]|uniref:Inner membrane protein YbhQ n=1 Tax=Salmonella enterica I TaxID=59201 RepID=A0A379UN25_SALET|nr:Inner membrane protein YbhQ [Salmonella enterica subsp. enterica]
MEIRAAADGDLQRELDGDGRHHLAADGSGCELFSLCWAYCWCEPVSRASSCIFRQASACWEAVFLALLAGEHTSQGTIIAPCSHTACFTYFIPLLLALVCYLILESRAKKLRAKNERAMAK